MDAAEIIRRLGLVPHPEGGYCRETFRSPLMREFPEEEQLIRRLRQ